jgi:N-acyl-D-aspartate/D-glutamate deacylase
MAKALGEYDRGCIQYTQASGSLEDPVTNSKVDMGFAGRLSETSNRPVMFNAIAVIDERAQVFRNQLQVLKEHNSRGVPLIGQAVTIRLDARFTFENWNLFDNVEAWRIATLGSPEERRAKLANSDLRQAMREEYDQTKQPKALGDMADFIVTEVVKEDLKKYEGLSARQIADMENKHVVDAILDISIADNLKTEWISPVRNANPANCKELLDYPYIAAGISDGGAHMKFLTLGAYPTDLLMWMVRDNGLITQEEAHYHLSYLPAWAAGFKDRGCIREGLAADLMIYDLDKLNILPREIVYDVPPNDWRRVRRAEGYRWLMVNGDVTFEDGKCTNALPGKLMRRS